MFPTTRRQLLQTGSSLAARLSTGHSLPGGISSSFLSIGGQEIVSKKLAGFFRQGIRGYTHVETQRTLMTLKGPPVTLRCFDPLTPFYESVMSIAYILSVGVNDRLALLRTPEFAEFLATPEEIVPRTTTHGDLRFDSSHTFVLRNPNPEIICNDKKLIQHLIESFKNYSSNKRSDQIWWDSAKNFPTWLEMQFFRRLKTPLGVFLGDDELLAAVKKEDLRVEGLDLTQDDNLGTFIERFGRERGPDHYRRKRELMYRFHGASKEDARKRARDDLQKAKSPIVSIVRVPNEETLSNAVYHAYVTNPVVMRGKKIPYAGNFAKLLTAFHHIADEILQSQSDLTNIRLHWGLGRSDATDRIVITIEGKSRQNITPVMESLCNACYGFNAEWFKKSRHGLEPEPACPDETHSWLKLTGSNPLLTNTLSK